MSPDRTTRNAAPISDRRSGHSTDDLHIQPELQVYNGVSIAGLRMVRHRILTTIFGSILVLLTAYIYNTIRNPPMSSTESMIPRHAIVVGSGLAGLTASTHLLSHRIPVVLLERASKPGGNSIKASSGINGSPTKYQPIPEPQDAFCRDTVKSAGKCMTESTASREKLIEKLTQSSSAAIEWLVEKGIDLSKVAQLGGHSFARTHRGNGQTPPGFSIISTLLNRLKEDTLFDLRTNCTVTSLLHQNNRVTGVQFTHQNGTTENLHGPVIFAAGGFGGDANGLLAKYRPDLAGYPSTNDPRPGTQPLLTAAGAQLIDMDQVQVHPTGFIDLASPSSPLKFLAAEMLRGEGGILLMNGKRFVNELDTREHVTNAITSVAPMSSEQGPKMWDVKIVLDEGTYRAAKSHVDFYVFKGLMKKTSIEDLGPDALASIAEYAHAVSKQTPDQFGRTAFANWELREPQPESVVYVGSVTPVVHFTMGGVLINEKSEILGENGEGIPGLWGAGEVTGGVHGGNRLGGSSLLECVVFGRVAGEQVVEYIESNSGA